MAEESLFDLVREKAAAKRIPFACHFDLTYQCNLDCVHCYINREGRNELKTAEIKLIIDELAAMGCLYLTFSGGEVFTREDFFEIGEYARKLHFALRISTNGLLIDEEIADGLKSLNPDYISFSIYSINPEIHDNITGVSGSLEQTIKAAEMLRDRNIKLKINLILMKQNIDGYHQVYELAQRLGADCRPDSRITPKMDGDKSPLQFQISTDESYEILLDQFSTLKESKSEEDPAEPHSKNFFEDIPCGAAHNFLYISPYGDVFPCVQLPLLCGNLRESSLKEIWYDSLQMLEINSLRISQLPCSQCELIDHCQYCPGHSYLEEGDVKAAPLRTCQQAALTKKVKEVIRNEE